MKEENKITNYLLGKILIFETRAPLGTYAFVAENKTIFSLSARSMIEDYYKAMQPGLSSEFSHYNPSTFEYLEKERIIASPFQEKRKKIEQRFQRFVPLSLEERAEFEKSLMEFHTP